MTASTQDTSPSQSRTDHSPGLLSTGNGRLKVIAAVAVVGFLLLFGANLAIDTNHARRLDPALENAAKVAASSDYDQVLAAWQELVVNDGSRQAEFDDMLYIGENLIPSNVSNPKGTLLIGYDVETFGRVSCVVIGIKPTDFATGVSPNSCGISGLPADVQALILS